MSLITIVNQSYLDILQRLASAFGVEHPEFAIQYGFYAELFATEPKSIVAYDLLIEELDEDAVRMIHGKNESVLERGEHVGLIRETYMAIVFPNFVQSEKDALWKLVIDLLRYISIVKNTGKTLSVFEKIGQSVAEINGAKGDQQHTQADLVMNMFSQPDMMQNISSLFSNVDDLKTMLHNIGPLADGIGLGSVLDGSAAAGDVWKHDSDQESEESDDEADEESTSASTIMRKRNRRLKHAAKKVSKPASTIDALKQISKTIADIEITQEDADELKQGIEAVMQPDKDGSNSIADIVTSFMPNAEGSGSIQMPNMMQLMSKMMAKLPVSQDGDGDAEKQELERIISTMQGENGSMDLGKLMQTLQSGPPGHR